MPEELPPARQSATGSSPAAAAASGNVTYLDQALWRSLADAESLEEFCQSWLGLQSRMIGAVDGGIVVRRHDGSIVPAALWPEGFAQGGRLSRAVERVFREGKGVVLRNDAEVEAADGDGYVFHLAYPVQVDGDVAAVAAFQVAPRAQAKLQTAMRQLQWGVAWLHNRVLQEQVEPERRERKRLASALQLAGTALEVEGYRKSAMAVVTELATVLRCDRVSLGFQRGSQTRIEALSHSSQFGKGMNLIRSIGMAMGEAADQARPLVYPPPEAAGPRILHAHEQLARKHADGAICTVPFVDRNGRGYGAVTLERSAPEPFSDEEVELVDSVAALVGPILDAKRRNDRHLLGKIGDSVMGQLKRLFGPSHWGFKGTVAALATLTIFLVVAEGTFRVRARSTLEGEIQRVVSAPFGGFIEEAPVRGGDIVEEGTLLASLDVRDVRLEHQRWETERDQFRLQHRRAMAAGERANMNVLSKKIGQAEAQMALLQQRLDRARITAPFSGIVVSGDLSQSLGSPIEAGDVLFEIAPLDSYRVSLRIDERDVRNIRVGQAGSMILTSMPGAPLPFRVTKITPVSRAEDGRNYFRAEGRLEATSDRLRPGMEGFAKIDVERRKLVWIWTRDMVQWLRLKFWTWMP